MELCFHFFIFIFFIQSVCVKAKLYICVVVLCEANITMAMFNEKQMKVYIVDGTMI